MSGPNGDPNISIDDGIIEDEDEFEEEEYAAINSMLDQINSYLDDLEERNDALNGKLHDLMESNRQARLEFRAQLLQREEEDRPGDGDEDKDDNSSSSSPEKKDLKGDGGSHRSEESA